MAASQDSSKLHWLLAKGLSPSADAPSAGERSRKLKLRILVASIVAGCMLLTLLGAVLSLVNH